MRDRFVAPALLIAAITLAAHYARAREFGLYEDDLARIARAWRMNYDELYWALQYYLTSPGQGRPLHDSSIQWFGWLSGRWSEPLQAAYALGATITLTTNLLFLVLCRRLPMSAGSAVAAAALFALWPSDSTHAYLTHAFGIQPSCILVLAALLLYVAGHTRSAWLPASACLVIYEPYFVPFLAAPLLVGGRKVARHAAAGLLILGGVAGIRMLAGEHRVLAIGGSIGDALRNMAAGPFWAVAGVLIKPIRAVGLLGEMEPASWPWLAVGVALSASTGWWVLRQWQRQPSSDTARHLVVAGLVMLLLAYPLTFTVPAGYSTLFGRASRVHSVARIGAALLVASALGRRGSAAACLLSGWMALAFCGALRVQQEYSEAWRHQQNIWAAIAAMPVPPVSSSTAFVIPVDRLPSTGEALVIGWPTTLVLNDVFRFPAEWKARPRMYRRMSGSIENIARIEPVLSAILGPQPEHDFVEIQVSGDGRLTTNPAGTAPMEIDRNSPLARALKLH